MPFGEGSNSEIMIEGSDALSLVDSSETPCGMTSTLRRRKTETNVNSLLMFPPRS